MPLLVFKFAHIAFALVTLGIGSAVLYGMLIGKLAVRRAVVFLECFLITCATGLLIPLDHLPTIHLVAMLGVYVSGIAVLALCKFHLMDYWRAVFVVTIIALLCLNIFASVVHIFKFTPIFETLAPGRSKVLFYVTEIAAMLPLAGLSLFAVNKLRNRTMNSLEPR